MGIGARVTLSAQGRRQYRHVYAGHGFGSQHQTRLLFGLRAGSTGADTVIVDWPSQKRSLLMNIAAKPASTKIKVRALKSLKDMI